MIDQIYLDALTAFGADDVPHSTRNLSEHLIGTHNLLKLWKAPCETCLAGLFHSIYGTARFINRTMPIPPRQTVQGIIGQEAELLVYLFCVTDRREFFANIGCSLCILHNIRNQTQWSGSPDILNQLLTMDLANWLEMFPYIGHGLTQIEVSRTIEMFEAATDSFPAMAIDTLLRFKQTQVRQSPEAPERPGHPFK